MNLQDLGNIGEFLGAVGVIGSLIYVGFQVRQHTKTMRAQMHENVTAGYLAVVDTVVANAKAFSAGIGASPEEFASFSDEDKIVIFGTIFGFFKHFEHMYSQHRRGFIDEEAWNAWSEHILMYFHQPGVQMWWALRRGAFVPPFREFLETSSPPDMESMVDVMRKSSA